MSDTQWSKTGPTLSKPCPTEILLGTEGSRWPVQAFTVEAHAAIWLAEPDHGCKRRVFRARLVDIQELELEPAPPTRGLRPRPAPDRP